MMKFPRTAKRLIASALAVSCLMTGAGATAFTNAFHYGYNIGQGTAYTRLEGKNSAGVQKTNYISYTPNSTITPVIVYASDKLYGSGAGISAAAKYLEQQGKQVIAGINADFFVMNTSIPIGLVIKDGELISSDAWQYAVGFTANGAAITGQPTMSMRVSGPSGTATISYFNKTRTAAGIYLLDRNYDSTSHTTQKGKTIVLERLDSTPVTVSGSVRLRVLSNEETTGATPIGANQMVMTMQDKSTASWVDFQPGEEVTLTVAAPSPGWADVVYAVGGKSLVRGGAVTPDGIDGAGSHTGRTAVGVKPDGTVILYQNDGSRSGGSAGLTARELGVEMQQLGCTEVICLDGGGSSVMSMRKPGTSGTQTISNPSDGSERRCANYIFLVSNAAADGVPAHLYVEPEHYYVLPGAQTGFTVRAADSAYGPAPLPGGEAVFTATAGDVDPMNHIFFSYPSAGTVTLAADIGGVAGETQVCVTDDVNSIALKRGDKTVTSLALDPGDVVELDAWLYHLGMRMASADQLLDWSVSGEIGTVDVNGNFTAGSQSGAGKLTVAYKNTSKSIDVTVGMDFRDVKNADWFYEAVKFCFDHGLMAGSTPTKFDPNGKLTRAMFAAVLYRLEGSPAVSYTEAFSDVPRGAWYADAVIWANQNGIVSGFRDGTFGGDGTLTREQLASMLCRYAEFKGMDAQTAASLGGFSDAGSVSGWAEQAMGWAVHADILGSTSSTAKVLSPAGTATRAQCASILMRFAALQGVKAEPEPAPVPEQQPVSPEQYDFQISDTGLPSDDEMLPDSPENLDPDIFGPGVTAPTEGQPEQGPAPEQPEAPPEQAGEPSAEGEGTPAENGNPD